MFGKFRYWRWLIGVAALTAVECAGVAAIELALTAPAEAQWWMDNRYPFLSRQRQHQRQRPGIFQNFFEPFGGPPQQEHQQQQQYIDHSRAPSPRKPDPKAPPVVPTISIMVMGDGMADWLAYGLEDAFADSPEIGVVRKDKNHSGLLRYQAKSELDWWHVARDILSKEKANYVIMMLGVSDRQNIREKDLAKADEENADDQKDKKGGDKGAQKKDNPDNADEGIIAPESKPAKKSNGIIEFRSDRWAKIYSHRIDETVAALKSKGVPVFWVGLPSIRGTKSTADAVYLNDLYRARAERAGAIYVDVWDGFVDEAGKYTSYGPDYEGQMRRLRSGDGVYFTKAGARKLAHFVERELRRYMNSHTTPVALPAAPIGPVTAPGKSAVRPLAGPVVPLATTPANSEELIGGTGMQPRHIDPLANRVLVRGEPVAAPPGRADDFSWPPGSGDTNKRTVGRGDAAAAPAEDVKQPAMPQGNAAGKTGENSQRQAKTPDVAQAAGKKPAPAPHRQARPRGTDPLGWFR